MHTFRSQSISPRMLLTAVAALSIGAATSANASVLVYAVTLDGPSESPPNASPGVGTGTVTVDTVANTMHVQVSFSGLLGTTTASHIHAATLVPVRRHRGRRHDHPDLRRLPARRDLRLVRQHPRPHPRLQLQPVLRHRQRRHHGHRRSCPFQAIADGKAYLNIHSTVVRRRRDSRLPDCWCPLPALRR